LMAIISLSSGLLPSIMNVALVSIPLNEAKVAIERMFEFTQLTPEETEVQGEDYESKISRISLNKIAFRFPGQKLLISDVCLNIERGSIVALVGESGTGKSTLVNILMRFYQHESGSVKVNDTVDSKIIPLNYWRMSIGLIPQDVHIFNGTVLENIVPDADETRLKQLAHMASEYGLETFVSSLPLGFATLTGEDGVKLSGGQKQVIAFMRALINEPDILLIDEGTSGMDRDTEDIILKILMRIKTKVGILLVTHRINIIRKLCDRIYLLEGTTITAAGSHNELINLDNLYKRYWDDYEPNKYNKFISKEF
jgi:ABC-type multidrug transport system fused ATPase/permease subunit